MARPTKLTPEVQRKLVGPTRAGVYLTCSAPFAGVSRPTVRSWIKRGEAEMARVDAGESPDEREEPYAEFARAMMQAKAYANVMDMMVIRQAARHDPKWALWSFKLRNPERFGPRATDDSGRISRRVSLHDKGSSRWT